MKKLLLITSTALVGLVSQATAALMVVDVDSTALATELRSLNKTDWAGAVSTGMLNTSAGMFVKNNSIDDSGVSLSTVERLVVESIYKQANFVNLYDEASAGQLLTNLDLTESKKITTDVDTTLALGFATETTNINPAKSAGSVGVDNNANVWTYTAGSNQTSHFLWLLEDFDVNAIGRDEDFNDFIVLGTISAVPEPSTIISLIAVGFLGFVTWRNRRKAKA
jgi:hypothetical protein